MPISPIYAYFPGKHHEKVLDQGSKHIVYEFMDIQEKSHECSELGKMIHESSKCTSYSISDITENCSEYRCGNSMEASIDSSNLNRHRIWNIGEDPCKHKGCGKCLNLCSIISQNQRMHIGKKEHRTAEYDKSLDSKHKLMRKQILSGEKAQQCIECGKCFWDYSSLSRHQKIHSREKLYKCKKCGKGFYQLYQVKDHYKTHTEDRPFKCSDCEKSFPVAHILENIRIFTQERNHIHAVNVTNALAI